MTDPGFSATVERFTGFGALYDRMRPSPPEALADLLLPTAQYDRPDLVADLGSGTGLSTRYWARYACSVIGVEPTGSMREQAETIGGDNVSYRKGFSHAAGLPDGCADLVTCSILRDGGVFAACDYDWPPSTSFWEVDRAYSECMARVRSLEREHGITERVRRWDKAGHLERMRESGRFRYVREHPPPPPGRKGRGTHRGLRASHLDGRSPEHRRRSGKPRRQGELSFRPTGTLKTDGVRGPSGYSTFKNTAFPSPGA
jgi:SAM-dependent methyltransferase